MQITGETEGGILRGNLGWSKTGKGTVWEVIGRRLPATAELALWAALPMIGIGIWLGVVSAVNHNKLIDQILRVFSIVGWSIPTFVFGLIVLLFFYAKLGWFPPGRLSDWASQIVQSADFVRYTNMNTIDALLNGRLDIFRDAVQASGFACSNPGISGLGLFTAGHPFVHAGYPASGLYDHRPGKRSCVNDLVISRHALPNALIPVVTVGALMLIGLLNGVVITETIFNLPGMGSFLAESALSLDVISVLGVTLFNCFILLVGNLIVDILYGVIDPRIRLQ